MTTATEIKMPWPWSWIGRRVYVDQTPMTGIITAVAGGGKSRSQASFLIQMRRGRWPGVIKRGSKDISLTPDYDKKLYPGKWDLNPLVSPPQRTYGIRRDLTPPQHNVKIRPIGEYWDGEETVVIWLVHGRSVRDHLLINFTQGGHHYRYNRIPENEIWIDDANYEERVPIIDHEVHERQEMKFKHRAYSPAHDRANRHEQVLRRRLNYDETIEALLRGRML